MEAVLSVGNFSVNPGELRKKGLVGEVMWDIAFADSSGSSTQEGYMELLESTAIEIIEKVELDLVSKS